MGITYGTILGITIFPLILFNTFLDNTNGSLWLDTIDTKQTLEQKLKKKNVKYYPTFLNVLIKTGKAGKQTNTDSKNEDAFKVNQEKRVLDYEIGSRYNYDFIHFHEESVNFVHYSETQKVVNLDKTLKKKVVKDKRGRNWLKRVWAKLSGAKLKLSNEVW